MKKPSAKQKYAPKYDHSTIESKWQKKWANEKIYRSKEDHKKDKYYVLDMFPYPSGEGLHVGHPKGYIATDVISRFKRMHGYSILHPMGFDAFGLPAENYALKTKTNPADSVKKNIKRFKKQLEILGLDYDWSREINTTDPSYYKWTQWIFLQMFKKGLAYESYEPIIWCPSCKTGLANEDVEDGRCERCGTPIEKKPMKQWVLKITEYAERLLKDLYAVDKNGKALLDWPESIRELQKNWIGRSEGALIDFDLVVATEDATHNQGNDIDHSLVGPGNKNNDEIIKIFTTRPDTLFGATYIVLSPEHTSINKLLPNITNKKEVNEYISHTKEKTEIERTDATREKTGVMLEGIKAVNPANKEKIPVWIADYVFPDYGTGAIMAVPAHDERDWEFAQKYKLPIKQVIKEKSDVKSDKGPNRAFTGKGIMVNSGKFCGKDSQLAQKEITSFVGGQWTTAYKLRNWVFSRQRYWGEPIPIIHCDKCGVVAVPEKELPVRLPKVKSYEPTGTGESPLAAIKSWVNVKCPKCRGKAKRETNTMPQWAGSSWYYLRYKDPNNKKRLVDSDKEKYWSSVDLYVGGAEHATRHLIYARFWHKFLYDLGITFDIEPFKKLQHVGLIMGEDGKKMSKRFGNVVNPDDIVRTFGADSLRIYEMFMGPFDQQIAWNTSSIIGARRFVEKVWKLMASIDDIKESTDASPSFAPILHRTIKKVTEDIQELRFNTAISTLMIAVNEMEKMQSIDRGQYEILLQLLAPFAPHVTQELWNVLGNKKTIHISKWPEYDANLIVDSKVTIVVQVNGKVRGSFKADINSDKTELENMAKDAPEVKKWLKNKQINRVIVVPRRLVNIVLTN
jgi:leucyl-tRNA synthetase